MARLNINNISMLSMCMLLILCTLLSTDAFVAARSIATVTTGPPRLDGNNSKICNVVRCLSHRCGGGTIDNIEDINNDKSKKQGMSLLLYTLSSWYLNQLETHELRTKFVSSGLLALFGDVCAQRIASSQQIDTRRMLAMFIDGIACTGPLLHYVYETYEWILPTHDKVAVTGQASVTENSPLSARRRLFATTIHVLFDNFVMVLIYILILMTTTGVLEGRSSNIIHELRNDFFPAVKSSYKVSLCGYVPVQLVGFHFLPMKFRVLVVNLLDIVWVTVLSYVTHRNRH